MTAEVYTIKHTATNVVVCIHIYKHSTTKQTALDVKLAANICLPTWTKTKIS